LAGDDGLVEPDNSPVTVDDDPVGDTETVSAFPVDVAGDGRHMVGADKVGVPDSPVLGHVLMAGNPRVVAAGDVAPAVQAPDVCGAVAGGHHALRVGDHVRHHVGVGPQVTGGRASGWGHDDGMTVMVARFGVTTICSPGRMRLGFGPSSASFA
jgi:hypothetical protein